MMVFKKTICFGFICSIIVWKSYAEYLISSRACDFSDILQRKYFKDNTQMISQLMDDDKRVFIGSHRGFGKSCNLNMLKYFFEIQVTDDGNAPSNVNTTTNYKLFMENNLSITYDTNVMDQYFGRYPVIWLDLQDEQPIKTSEEFVEYLKHVIHSEFKRHAYLKKSAKLTAKNKTYIERWINYKKMKSKNSEKVILSLRKLSRLLSIHFNTTCYVFIDGYNSILTRTMFKTEPEELDNILIIYKRTLLKLFDGNKKAAARSLVTGSSFIHSRMEFLFYRRYTWDYEYIEYYGLNSTDVVERFSLLGISKEEGDKYLNYFGSRKGDRRGWYRFSTSSFVQYLENRELCPAFPSPMSWLLYRGYRVIRIRNTWELLMCDRFIKLSRLDITRDYVVSLIEGMKYNETEVLSEFFFSYLADYGYFISIDLDATQYFRAKLANLAVKEELQTGLLRYYSRYESLKAEVFQNCANYLEQFVLNNSTIYYRTIVVNSSVEILKAGLRDIKKELERYFASLDESEVSEGRVFANLITICGVFTQYKCELVEPGNKFNLTIIKDDIGVLIDIKNDETSREYLQRDMYKIYPKPFHYSKTKYYVVLIFSPKKGKKISISCFYDTPFINNTLYIDEDK